MLKAQDVYVIAKKRKAEITAGRQIQWLYSGNTPGWNEMLQFHPSVMDALILDRAADEENYLEAAKKATGWAVPTIYGFQQTMLLGEPLETQHMYMESFMYWKGVVLALMVIEKLRSRQREAERYFS